MFQFEPQSLNESYLDKFLNFIVKTYIHELRQQNKTIAAKGNREEKGEWSKMLVSDFPTLNIRNQMISIIQILKMLAVPKESDTQSCYCACPKAKEQYFQMWMCSASTMTYPRLLRILLKTLYLQEKWKPRTNKQSSHSIRRTGSEH